MTSPFRPSPKFIAIEGPDFSGKTTMTKMLAEALTAAGTSTLTVHDPGTTALGQHLRPFLKDPNREAMMPSAEILLFNAAKHEMYGKLVQPALQKGQWVITDRYTMSTCVYQGFMRDLNMATFTKLMGDTQPPEPHLYIVLLVNEQVAKARAEARGGDLDFFEKNANNQAQVRVGYSKASLWTKSNILYIETSEKEPADVLEVIKQVFHREFGIFPELAEPQPDPQPK